MLAYFERFTIEMTLAQARSASHSGPCDADVEVLLKVPKIARQLRKLDPSLIRAELDDYGSWDDDALFDYAANQRRIVWIAAGNITEESCST